MVNNVTAGVIRPTSATRNSASNIQLPEIPKHILTSGQTNISDDKFKDKILEMARRDVAAGRNSRFTPNGCSAGSNEFRSLMNDFISSASPNRAGIINNTLTELRNRLSQMMPRINFGKNLLSLLMNNSRLFGSRDIGSNFINFRDSSGNLVAMFSELPTGGWGFTNVSTPAENGRAQEFFRLWDDAIVRAGEEHLNAATVIDLKKNGISVDLAALKEKGSVFNMSKLAAAGITLDAETGRTIVNMPARGGATHNTIPSEISNRYEQMQQEPNLNIQG